MKIFKPLVAFLTLLVIVSFLAGFVFDSLGIVISYSSTYYLLVCFATAGHFLEEFYTKAWEIEGKLRANPDGTPKPPLYDIAFFKTFSHSIVLLSFLFYFPITAGFSWSLVYGLGIVLNGILNGVVHFGILVKFRKNTGCISGTFLLIFGILTILSIAV